MARARTSPLRPCPACGRDVAVVRSTEQLRPHGPNNSCPGSGAPVDLYGGGR